MRSSSSSTDSLVKVNTRNWLAVLFVLLTGLILALPVLAAAPRIIIIHGSLLRERVVLSDRDQNLKFMLSISEPANISEDQLNNRPYLDIAMFWGPAWVAYVEAGRSLDELQPDQANQHGRFYPATNDLEPIFVFDHSTGAGGRIRSVKPPGLDVLYRNGVPIVVKGPSLPRFPFPDFLSWLVTAILILLVGAILTRRYRRAIKMEKV